jgi:hypothetical protein
MRRWIAGVAIVIGAWCGPAACVARPDLCWVCEREVHGQVRATLVLANGRSVPACCPRCALHYRQEPGHPVRSIRVTDYPSQAGLPLERAWLVEGSDETPCLAHHPVVDAAAGALHVCYDRCMPSLIAFRDADAARGFMTAHGGTLRAPGAITIPGATAPGSGPAATPPPAAPR